MTASNAHAVTPKSVHVSRVIRAPRERVFEAWVNPEIRRKWWHNSRGEGPTHCAIDARVGGRYCIKQIGCGGETPEQDDNREWIMEGEFLEFVPPERLVFTWNVNHEDEPHEEERVTIDFREVAEGTELTIKHEGILSTRLRDGTNDGWTKLSEILATVLEEK